MRPLDVHYFTPAFYDRSAPGSFRIVAVSVRFADRSLRAKKSGTALPEAAW
jgi:hypothetical protein